MLGNQSPSNNLKLCIFLKPRVWILSYADKGIVYCEQNSNERIIELIQKIWLNINQYKPVIIRKQLLVVEVTLSVDHSSIKNNVKLIKHLSLSKRQAKLMKPTEQSFYQFCSHRTKMVQLLFKCRVFAQ